MKLIITTPEKIIFEGDAEKVNILTTDGVITVLSHHISLIFSVKRGEMRISIGEKDRIFKNGSGVIEINHNKASILLKNCDEL